MVTGSGGISLTERGDANPPPPKKKDQILGKLEKPHTNIPWVQVVVTDILQEEHTNPAEFVSKTDHGL